MKPAYNYVPTKIAALSDILQSKETHISFAASKMLESHKEPPAKKRKLIDLTVTEKEKTLSNLPRNILARILLDLPSECIYALKCCSKEYMALMDYVDDNEYWRCKISHIEKVNICLASSKWKEIYDSMYYPQSVNNKAIKEAEYVREYVAAVKVPAGKEEDYFRSAILNRLVCRVSVFLHARNTKDVLFKYTIMAISLSNKEIVRVMLYSAARVGATYDALTVLLTALDRSDIGILETVTVFYKSLLCGVDGKWNPQWSGILLHYAVKARKANVMKFLLERIDHVSQDILQLCLNTACHLNDKDLVVSVMGVRDVPVSAAVVDCAKRGEDHLVALIMSIPHCNVSDDGNALIIFSCSTGRSGLAITTMNHQSFNCSVPWNKHITLAIDNKHIELAISIIRHPKSDVRAYNHAVVKHCLDRDLFSLARAILVDKHYQ